MKKVIFFWVFLSALVLCSCAGVSPVPDAPCDNFGQHCDPKMPINHR
jgi:hypothetical protein